MIKKEKIACINREKKIRSQEAHTAYPMHAIQVKK